MQKALGDSSLAVSEWKQEAINYGALNPVTEGVYRFSGLARGKAGPDNTVEWRLILEVLRQALSKGRSEPGYLKVWQRELLAYSSGILKPAGGLRPGRCIEAQEQGESAWLWLEDLGKETKWSLERHLLAARHFGGFAAVYSAKQLDAFWLCRGFSG
ncbi:MAG: hypothetical protein M1157_02095 [Deinococcus sp.]|nr:hypothetical protein [Deinococcus sp.]